MADQMDDNKVLVLSWVLKKSVKTHQWKKRWAVLRNCQFSYYKSSSEHKPSTVINKNDLLSFASIPGGHKYHFAIYSSKKAYHFRVDSPALFEQWISALKSVLPDQEDELVDEDPDSPKDNTPNLCELSATPDSTEYLVEEGKLLVLKKRYSQWKKQYVIVTNQHIYVCKSEEKSKLPEKVISVCGLLDVVEVGATKGKKWCLMLIENKKTHILSASSEQDMTMFLLAIKAVILQYRSKSNDQ